MSQGATPDDGRDVFVSDDGEFHLYPPLRPGQYAVEEIVPRPKQAEVAIEDRVSFVTRRFELVSGGEAQAARALLAERDQLRQDLAFALEYAYKLLIGSTPPMPLSSEDERRWYRLYRRCEREEWFREANC